MDSGVSALVFDFGSRYVKAGWAGESAPSVFMPSAVGYRKSLATQSDPTSGDVDMHAAEDIAIDGTTDVKPEASTGLVQRPGPLSQQPLTLYEEDMVDREWKKKSSPWYMGAEKLYRPVPDGDIRHPIQGGVVHDWEALEALWRHVYDRELQVDPSSHPVLVAQSLHAPVQDTRRMARFLFETLNVPAVYFAPSPVLSAFASATHTALVLDVGAGHSSATPVVDGVALRRRSIHSTTMCGGLLEDALAVQLRRRVLQAHGNLPVPADPSHIILPRFAVRHQRVSYTGVAGTADATVPVTDTDVLSGISPSVLRLCEQYTVSDVMACCLEVSETALNLPPVPDDRGVAVGVGPSEYQLPDCTTIHMGVERLAVPEVLFHPATIHPLSDAPGLGVTDLMMRAVARVAQPTPTPAALTHGGETHTSIHGMAHAALTMCNDQTQRDLLGCVVPVGGVTNITGFNTRLKAELEGSEALTYRIKVHTSPMSGIRAHRGNAPMIGGGIVSSLSAFGNMWVTKAQYQEKGDSIDWTQPL
ncbi:actin family protein [Kipferlia bialata]|uniref:Actin family protein n=1 Tax=Kipferlia bialata TaxID=797122 RepID=A0A9K3CVY5_9EUKA|nr:actin family protein [Kipferlia bialata]|eukprot:g5380.t1